MRRVLLQVHLWVGLIAGVYVVVIAVTGAALVFRIDLQRVSHPHLFTAAVAGELAEPVAIMESVARAYPDHRLSGVDAPTTSRPTYLAYVTSPAGFRTVLIDPVTATVLGELPDRSAVRTLQQLHYDLLAGPTGRIVNGIGAAMILVLGLSGICVWWPGRAAWWRGFRIDTTRRGYRLWWEVHRAVGIWSVLLILMWALTGLYFAFPRPSRALIASIFAVSATRSPMSSPPGPGASELSWQAMIDRARAVHPHGHVARVVLPFGDRGAVLVMFAGASPTPAYAALDSVYLDRVTGEHLPYGQARTIGDVVVGSMATLHVGAFGGTAIRVIWFVFGLMPAVLFITGVIVWWNRTWWRRP